MLVSADGHRVTALEIGSSLHHLITSCTSKPLHTHHVMSCHATRPLSHLPLPSPHSSPSHACSCPHVTSTVSSPLLRPFSHSQPPRMGEERGEEKGRGGRGEEGTYVTLTLVSMLEPSFTSHPLLYSPSSPSSFYSSALHHDDSSSHLPLRCHPPPRPPRPHLPSFTDFG
jgi:hypothetical protein